MTPREWIGSGSFEGRHVRLEPLGPQHIGELFDVTTPETFRYFGTWPAEWTRECVGSYLQGFIDAESRQHYAVIDRASGKLVGSTSYLDVRPEHKGLEVGFTWYAPSARGTRVNPECKLLLLTHAFEKLGCERVQLKSDARNMHSRAAMAKMGAQFEGVLRKTLILADGHVRDNAMFSVVKSEWPDVKKGLEARLR